MDSKTLISDSRVLPHDLDSYINEHCLSCSKKDFRLIGTVVGPLKFSPQKALEALCQEIPIEKKYQVLKAEIREVRGPLSIYSRFYWTGVAYAKE